MAQPATALVHPLALLCAIGAAALMGFAIQQGGTCMVAAIESLVTQRSPRKIGALAECSLWTTAFGLLAMMAGLSFAASPAYALTLSTVTGGLLLGIGAWLNGACVFGSIARIGGRDWHYLLTPPGYLLGSWFHARAIGTIASPDRIAPGVEWSLPFALLLVASLCTSLYKAYRTYRRRIPLSSLWDYRHATVMIGLAFVVLAVLAGPWTYTEALARTAHGTGWPGWPEFALFVALLLGAIAGGRHRSDSIRFFPRIALCCLAGGALMGFGGALVPGGNDNLILVGLPGLQPHAWLAIAVMIVGILLSKIAGTIVRGGRKDAKTA